MDVLFDKHDALYVRFQLAPDDAPIWIDELEIIPAIDYEK